MNPQAIPEAENSAGSGSRSTPRDEAGAPRITVSRGDLAAAVAHAGRALPKRAALPVLTGMRAEVTGSRLTLAAFDYEKAARASVDGSAAAPGAILADGPQLAAAVKALPRGKSAAVTLEAGTSALTLACEGARSTVPLLAHPEDHPGLPDLPPAAGTVAGEAFARSVSRVAAAASADDTLPALTCVRLGLRPDGTFTLAATDRYRLATDETAWTPADLDAVPRDILVPAADLARFAAGCGDKVTIFLAPDQRPDNERGLGGSAGLAGFSDGAREVIVHVNDGAFPRITDLLHRQHATTATCDAGALGDAVRRAGRMCGRGEPVSVGFAPAGVTVCPVRDGAECGSQTVPATLTGPPARTAFNPVYLASMLAGVDGAARISLTEPTKPALITAGSGDDQFRVVIVPMRYEKSA
jgi:DNA polymerase III subunit beta